jgi:hypothetical protein
MPRRGETAQRPLGAERGRDRHARRQIDGGALGLSEEPVARLDGGAAEARGRDTVDAEMGDIISALTEDDGELQRELEPQHGGPGDEQMCREAPVEHLADPLTIGMEDQRILLVVQGHAHAQRARWRRRAHGGDDRARAARVEDQPFEVEAWDRSRRRRSRPGQGARERGPRDRDGEKARTAVLRVRGSQDGQDESPALLVPGRFPPHPGLRAPAHRRTSIAAVAREGRSGPREACFGHGVMGASYRFAWPPGR